MIHSFDGNSVCFDRTRLNVVQTEYFPDASINMRTFKFNIGGSVAESQQQTVICSLHLDPVTAINQEQANECTCYSQSECEETEQT